MGIESKTLGLGKHLVNTKEIIRKAESIPIT